MSVVSNRSSKRKKSTRALRPCSLAKSSRSSRNVKKSRSYSKSYIACAQGKRWSRTTLAKWLTMWMSTSSCSRSIQMHRTRSVSKLSPRLRSTSRKRKVERSKRGKRKRSKRWSRICRSMPFAKCRLSSPWRKPTTIWCLALVRWMHRELVWWRAKAS
jgi:hypothetical protein